MTDMSSVIVPKSDQINADDLIAGPMTITIREVKIRGGEDQPVSIYFDGSDKAFRPCKSMSRVLVQGWGADAKAYVGRSLTLYRDPDVKWAGMKVGGIRISHMSDISGEKLMMLTETRGSRKPHKVQPLNGGAAPSAAEPTQADALKAIEEAAKQGTDALSTIWRQKWMAPHRDALAADLDRLKAVAAANDAPAGAHPAEAKANQVLADLATAPDEAAIDSIVAAFKPHEEATPEPLRMKIEVAISDARQRVAAKDEADA